MHGGVRASSRSSRGVLDEDDAPAALEKAADRSVVADVGRDAEDARSRRGRAPRGAAGCSGLVNRRSSSSGAGARASPRSCPGTGRAGMGGARGAKGRPVSSRGYSRRRACREGNAAGTCCGSRAGRRSRDRSARGRRRRPRAEPGRTAGLDPAAPGRIVCLRIRDIELPPRDHEVDLRVDVPEDGFSRRRAPAGGSRGSGARTCRRRAVGQDDVAGEVVRAANQRRADAVRVDRDALGLELARSSRR